MPTFLPRITFHQKVSYCVVSKNSIFFILYMPSVIVTYLQNGTWQANGKQCTLLYDWKYTWFDNVSSHNCPLLLKAFLDLSPLREPIIIMPCCFYFKHRTQHSILKGKPLTACIQQGQALANMLADDYASAKSIFPYPLTFKLFRRHVSVQHKSIWWMDGISAIRTQMNGLD